MGLVGGTGPDRQDRTEMKLVIYLIKNGNLCLYSFSYKTLMLGQSSVALIERSVYT